MKEITKLFYLVCIIFFINGCGDLLSDYESKSVDPMRIDQDICSILNEMESVNAMTFQRDSLTQTALFDSLVNDTSSFINLSNINNWRIPVDSSCYFILFAPQVADTYVVVLNSSSELKLYDNQGSVIYPDNSTTSLKNVAGCPEARTRQAYSELSGTYLAKLVNPNVTSLKLVVMNTNTLPSANFSTSANSVFIGDTIIFTDQSEEGNYPILTYSWDFGDNNTNSDSSVVQHVYSDSGQYSPSLTVSDGYLFHTITKNGLIRVSAGGEE